MQSLTPVTPSGIATGSARTPDNVPPLAGPRPDAPVLPRPVTAQPVSVLQGGLRDWNPQLNQQFSGAQQTIDFLDEAGGQLQQLKRGLGAQLAAREPKGDAVAETLQQFTRNWRERPAATGGRLSPRLAYSAEGAAPQRFTVRGMTLQTLRLGEKETLSFSVAGAGRSQPSVLVEPGLDDDSLVQRFDQALAASRIRVRQDNAGNLVFSTPESSWPQVRDSLSVRGGGIRFPTGQFHRVRADAEPDAVQPQGWRVDEPDAMRQTLAQVTQALDLVRRARTAVDDSLQVAGDALQAAQPAESAAGAATFASRFAAMGREHDFSSHASVAATLLGVRRDRVLSLLSLRD